MIKLLLFGLLCSLGFSLLRILGRTGGDAEEKSRPPIDRSRVVEAEFEEVQDLSGGGRAP